MIRPTTYCDECDRPKAEGNHWFRAYTIDDIFMIRPWGDEHTVFFHQPEENQKHLCSESCAIKSMIKAIGRETECPS